jgi:hypothetical protein
MSIPFIKVSNWDYLKKSLDSPKGGHFRLLDKVKVGTRLMKTEALSTNFARFSIRGTYYNVCQ